MSKSMLIRISESKFKNKNSNFNKLLTATEVGESIELDVPHYFRKYYNNKSKIKLIVAKYKPILNSVNHSTSSGTFENILKEYNKNITEKFYKESKNKNRCINFSGSLKTLEDIYIIVG